MKYVYGIIPSGQLVAQDLVFQGLSGAPLEIVAHNGIAAIISDAVPYDYAGLPKQQLVKVLAQHQQTTERIMQKTATFLPVKFGTLLQPLDVDKLLALASPDFEAALAKVTDHVELEVIAMWDLQRVFAQIAEQPEIAELRAQAAGKPPAEIQNLQIALGALVKHLLDARREAYLTQIRDTLSGVADDIETNAVVNDQVVANLAFLLPAARQAEFDRCVEALDRELGGELNFKVVGPLPPYSFTTVEVEHVLPDDVEWAQSQLGVACTPSGDEIRAAYLHQARLNHPDNNQEDAGAIDRFKEANSAYRLLRYCHRMQYRTTAPGIPENEYRCDLGQIADTGLLLVNISRSSDLAARN